MCAPAKQTFANNEKIDFAKIKLATILYYNPMIQQHASLTIDVLWSPR